MCHEAYHSYQYRLVDTFAAMGKEEKGLRMFGKINLYAVEFSHYIDGKDDFLGYYLQDCERDAREYAKSAVTDYRNQIMEHLSGEK